MTAHRKDDPIRYRISVDTGGTFTDVVVSDCEGRQVIGKALTTYGRIFDGMRSGLAMASELLKVSLNDLLSRADLLIYGTTIATNAIVEAKTAKTAFLTTCGFPDVLYLREGGRTNPHDFSVEYPAAYIPRYRTFEVPERVNAEGGIETALYEPTVREILAHVGQAGYEAIAVCLLWSVANPSHELRIGELIEELLPTVPYTLSHRLLPIVREYRRASATAIDASLKPLMQSHLRQMEMDLEAAGFAGDLLVCSSAGGCMKVAAAIAAPIHTTKSGPAMAPIAAKIYSEMEGIGSNIIVCDTGGTTFDVGLVHQGEIVFTRDTWIGGQYVGHIIATSSVDIRSLGAGGGSIAWVDAGGLLNVGPQSAGSEPGPACYGRGGTEPTVTDAAAVLGYLDTEKFLGGRMSLDLGAARRTVGSVGERLGKGTEDTAWAVLKIAGELMIKAINEITVAEGFDPKEAAIIAGGGAAGLNIMPIAAELGVERVILPRSAGALSAVGMQYADIIGEESGTALTTTRDFDYEGVNTVLDGMRSRLDEYISKMDMEPGTSVARSAYVEARYFGQVWDINVPLPVSRFDSAEDVAALVSAFHAAHERIYAVADPDSYVECLNWKMRVAISLRTPKTVSEKPSPHEAETPERKRNCRFDISEAILTPVYYGTSLKPGARVRGPAIVEEPTTTLVVYPGMEVSVSGAGNYILNAYCRAGA